MKNVAKKVIAKKNLGYKVVVVVSAPGDTTDDLIKMATDISQNPDSREMDMLMATGEQISIALLSIAIKEKGYSAISLTGAQVGIKTIGSHTKAKIKDISLDKILNELKKDNIVIVAGFQGIDENQDITTLGRGGSDLTAVAIAAVLKADECEIYTDVKGIYTTDPRIVKNAVKIEKISYDEILEMASLGSQVMQARSVEIAKKFGVIIHVRSTFSEDNGTFIVKEEEYMENIVVRGVAFDKNQVKISIFHLLDEPGVASRLFEHFAKADINIDMIVQSTADNGKNNISFTIATFDLKKTLSVIENVEKNDKDIKFGKILYDDNIAKISIVGIGMKSHAGVASKMFKTLADNKINIHLISTSEIKISCVIDKDKADIAVNAVHDAFELNKKEISI
ncbi:MAG: aspartate kinase [Elusimicrobiota bacterium]|nr:aspartate kinase [Elusimicrobiota bacterium]